jgi:hypothetical protein
MRKAYLIHVHGAHSLFKKSKDVKFDHICRKQNQHLEILNQYIRLIILYIFHMSIIDMNIFPDKLGQSLYSLTSEKNYIHYVSTRREYFSSYLYIIFFTYVLGQTRRWQGMDGKPLTVLALGGTKDQAVHLFRKIWPLACILGPTLHSLALAQSHSPSRTPTNLEEKACLIHVHGPPPVVLARLHGSPALGASSKSFAHNSPPQHPSSGL